MAFFSNSSPSGDNQSSSETDLNIINTEDEMCTDTTKKHLLNRNNYSI